jgi:MFS family permease
MVNESKDRTQFLTNKKKHKGKGLSFFTEAAMFESFHIRDFRWFWFGTFANFMAIGMQIMARSWLVLRLSDDSPLALSMVMVAFSLPMTVMALLGGALADRFPKKYIIMATQAVNALMTSLLATLDLTGLVRFWHLIVFGVVNGSLMAINVPVDRPLFQTCYPRKK